MSTSVAGSINSCINLAFTLALAVPPVGRWKTLSEGWFDNLNGFPPLPAVEVAPVSLIADGIVPFRIMVLMSSCINGFFCRVLWSLAFSTFRCIFCTFMWRGVARHCVLSLSMCCGDSRNVTIFGLLFESDSYFILFMFSVGGDASASTWRYFVDKFRISS